MLMEDFFSVKEVSEYLFHLGIIRSEQMIRHDIDKKILKAETPKARKFGYKIYKNNLDEYIEIIAPLGLKRLIVENQELKEKLKRLMEEMPNEINEKIFKELLDKNCFDAELIVTKKDLKEYFSKWGYRNKELQEKFRKEVFKDKNKITVPYLMNRFIWYYDGKQRVLKTSSQKELTPINFLYLAKNLISFLERQY